MTVRLDRLPDFLDKWDVDFKLVDDWQTRCRKSGDFVDVMGIIVHHTATSLTAERDLQWQYTNSPDKPIGNGLLARDGVFHLGAVRATNTAGKGGPYMTSRGVIPLDAANSRTFNVEAQNNGVGEPWSEAMCHTYPRLCAAILDCINATTPGAKLGAGDVFAHAEWAPTRKIDPAGPCEWCDTDDRYMRWVMDEFRGAVFTQLMAGPPLEDDMTDADRALLVSIADRLERVEAALTPIGNQSAAMYTTSENVTKPRVPHIDEMVTDYLWPFVQTIEERVEACQQALINHGWLGADGKPFPPVA